MSTRHRLLCFLFLLAAHATGCRTTHGVVDECHTAQLAVSAVGVKTQRSIFIADSIAVYTSSKDASPRNTRDASAAPKSLINKATDAIGLSTPEGRARRQARKDAAATVPRSMGKGAVWAPNNTGKILSAGNKSGPVANADTGATLSQTAIEKNKGAAATGPNASATQAIEKPGFWGTVAAGLSWWWLLLPAAYVGWRVYRKTIPFAS